MVQKGAKPPIPKRDSILKGKSTRFEDDEDDYVLDDDGEAHDQLEKMRSLEADRKPLPSGKAVSSYTRGGLSSASTRIVDLTSD